MDMQKTGHAALSEIGHAFGAIEAAEAETLVEMIAGAGRIALYGVGREGLMMRALAMRLFHLGLDAHVVGDMTTPPLGQGDLLLVSAGPGMFSTVAGLVGVARGAGVLPMGSLYEGVQFVAGEVLVLMLAERLGVSPETMRANHTNLE